MEDILDVCEGGTSCSLQAGAPITHPTRGPATLYPWVAPAERGGRRGQECLPQDESGCFVCLLDGRISQELLGPSRGQMQMSDAQAAQRHVHAG